MDDRASIPASLHRLASEDESRVLYAWLEDGDRVVDSLTTGDLDRRARLAAASILGRVHPGDRVLLAFPPGLSFIVAFYACLYAGVVAVPVYAPEGKRHAHRLAAIVRDSDARLVLTTGARAASATEAFVDLGGGASIPVQTLDEMCAGGAPLPGPLESDPGAIAFLQYTSGSTGDPKGVMVSHRNIAANVAAITELAGLAPHKSLVSWLPHFHDMGLIGGILLGAHVGHVSYLMAPLAFIQRPVRLLKAISKFRAVMATAPDFAYARCVARIKPAERAQLDLSSWAIAQCGAEPIRQETLDQFARTFAPHGFRREAFLPSFGLAEGTLMVSSAFLGERPAMSFDRDALRRGQARAVGEGSPGGRAIVGCGRTAAQHAVRIVDPETRVPCQDGKVGEVWFSGPSVAEGYWNKPQVTREVFAAHTADGEGPFLRTGDLGFFHERDLFIAGRIKELVIVNGQNHYPQDIERTVEGAHPAFRAGGGAVFSVEDGGVERVVLVHEVAFPPVPDFDAMAAQARSAVAEEHEVSLAAIVFVKPGGVPRTSSGKTMRRACSALFLGGELKAMGAWTGSAALRHLVAPYAAPLSSGEPA